MGQKLTPVSVLRIAHEEDTTREYAFESMRVLVTSAEKVAEAVAEALPHRPECSGRKYVVKYYDGTRWQRIPASGPARPSWKAEGR